MNRRQFLTAAGAGLGVTAAPGRAATTNVEDRPALVAITLDLEMARNFPRWEDTHWDYEKGNLDEPTKRYAVEACRRVKQRGGVIHCFCVGRVLEQENVDWLNEIAAAGHRIGNHTYDHVNVLATRPQDLQYRFQRAPWLLGQQSPRQMIAENVRLTTSALKTRLGIDAVGFRTPGGFANGLADRPDVQQLLQELSFAWVSGKYPPHKVANPPDAAVFRSIVEAQLAAQPFVYPTGLVEIPMSPISDIGAFRNGRWKLDDFLKAIRLAVEWAIERRAVFDFLGHPSCLSATDPQFRAIELICDLVAAAGQRAKLVDLESIYRQTVADRGAAGSSGRHAGTR